MKKKLLMTFLPLALLPLAGACLLSYILARNAITQKVYAQLESVASLQKSRVENYYSRNLERLAFIAEQLEVRISVDRYLPHPTPTDLMRLNRILERIRSSSSDLKSLSILSAKGKVIASSEASFINDDYSYSRLLGPAKSANVFDVASLRVNGTYGAYFAGPLRQDGKLMGILLVEQDMDRLFPGIHDYSGLGRTGETTLVKELPDGNALFLTSLRHDPQASMVRVVSPKDKLPLFEALKQKEMRLTYRVNSHGRPVIAMTRYVKNLNAGLVVEMDHDEAFGSILKLRNWFLVVFVLCALSVGFLAHFSAKSVVEPLHELTRLAESIKNEKTWDASSIRRQKNEFGILANAFLTMAKNLITSKEDLEREIRKRTSELQHSRMFLDSVFENIPHMIFVKDAKDLRFVSFNKAGEQLLGVSREELIGKNDYDFFPKKEADFFTEKDRSVLNSRLLVDIPEEPIHTQNGVRYLHTKKIPMINEQGQCAYLLGISEDITEVRKTEQILHQKQAELARSNAEREQLGLFASVAAHDLQEPLKKIISFGDLLSSECSAEISDDGKNYLSRMKKAAKRMSELISDLLKFSKVTSAHGTADAVDIKTVLDDVLADLELRIQESGARIRVGEMPVILANRNQLREVFQNLIANAIKFRKPNDVPIISLSSEELTEGGIKITIADNGIGFDQKFADRIFKPFERLHSRGEYEGSGIGLAICHRIVSRLGGQLSVESVIGKGSTFFITLPESVRVKGESTVAAGSTH